MDYLFGLVLVVLSTQLVDVSSKPSKSIDEIVISETIGHLYAVEDNGAYRRLHRRDVDNIKQDELHHLHLRLEDGTNPIDMQLQEGSVWGSDSVFIIRRGDRAFHVPHAVSRGCHLHGKVTSHDGAVTINRCGKMTGRIHTPGHHYGLEELPTEHEQDDRAHARFRVTKKKVAEEIIDDEDLHHLQHEMEKREIMEDDNIDDNNIDDDNNTSREKRSLRRISIELAIFADSGHLDHLFDTRGFTTYDQIRDWFVDKWNIIQGVYSEPRVIGAHVRIRVKKIEAWWNNPTDYPENHIGMEQRHRWFCDNTPQGDDFDQKVLYTKGTSGHQLGFSWVGKTCVLHRNCYIVKSATQRVFVELHEMGHNLGFPHDPRFGTCNPSSGHESNSGFMGWSGSYRFLSCYKTKLRQMIQRRSMRCLYRQDVSEELALELQSYPTTQHPSFRGDC